MSRAFVIARPDGVTRRVAGYRYAAPPSDAPRAGRELEKLPARVDLRRHLTPVEDQGDANSAVANAAAGAYEYLVARHRPKERYDVSRLFVYYNAREIAGLEDDDDGATIADAIEGLKRHGGCSESAWPYDAAHICDKPPKTAYQEGGAFAVEEAAVVPVDLAVWRDSLAGGYPIVFGIALSASFDRQRRPGLVPVPSDRELARKQQGPHAMLCVGYSDADSLFIVRNSWGPAWGDEGYCYIPYDYVMNPKLNRGDAWVLRRRESLKVDKKTHGEGSLLDEPDTLLARMDDDAWAGLLDALGETPLETRLALIFLAAAAADTNISDNDLAPITSALDGAFEKLGSPFEADKVLRQAVELIEDGALVDDSVGILGEHLDPDVLALVVRRAAEGANVDDLSEEEGVLADMIDAWLGGAAPREGGLVDGLVGEYADSDYANGVYDDDDADADDLPDGYGEDLEDS